MKASLALEIIAGWHSVIVHDSLISVSLRRKFSLCSPP